MPDPSPSELRTASDESLISLYTSGTSSAIEELYRRYISTMYRFLRALSLEDDHAEDVLQDAILQTVVDISRNPRSYQLPGNFRAHLFHSMRILAAEVLQTQQGESSPPSQRAEIALLQ